jgi:hypothetical protein
LWKPSTPLWENRWSIKYIFSVLYRVAIAIFPLTM